MTLSLQSKWTPGIVTMLTALLTLGSASHWALGLSAERSLPAPTPAPVTKTAAPVDPAQVARMLGAKAAASADQAAQTTQAFLASRFVLHGVLAGGNHGWAALISVDGMPARPVRVGGAVADDLVLHSVTGKTALIGAQTTGSALVALSMPEPQKSDNPRSADRLDDSLNNLERPARRARNPEMGQAQDDIDSYARRRLESRARNNPPGEGDPESMPNVPDMPVSGN